MHGVSPIQRESKKSPTRPPCCRHFSAEFGDIALDSSGSLVVAYAAITRHWESLGQVDHERRSRATLFAGPGESGKEMRYLLVWSVLSLAVQALPWLGRR